MRGWVVFRRFDPLKQLYDAQALLSHVHQRELMELTKLRRAVSDYATDAKRIELQLNHIQQQATRLEKNIRIAREKGSQQLVEGYESQLSAVDENLKKVRNAYEAAVRRENRATLESINRQQKVDTFRALKETFRAESNSVIQSIRSGSWTIHTAKSVIQGIDPDKIAALGAITDLLNPDLKAISTGQIIDDLVQLGLAR